VVERGLAHAEVPGDGMERQVVEAALVEDVDRRRDDRGAFQSSWMGHRSILAFPAAEGGPVP
jgi:hypothetical protein